nr:hypothetical protein [Thiomicrorhabdus sp.]
VVLTHADVVTTNADVATTNSNVTAAQTAQGLTETARDAAVVSADFVDDLVLGAKTDDPATDNDGNALQVGAVYYNTTLVPSQLKIWDGSVWNTAVFDATGVVTTLNGRDGAVSLSAADVNLGNADNTSDVNKPVSTAQQTALDGKLDGDTNLVVLHAGTTGDTTLRLADPGVGNSSTIDFDKTSDSARIIVTEHASDKTEFQFYMSDNPRATNDKFNWYMRSYRGNGADWKPLEFSAYKAYINAHVTEFNGHLNIGNLPFYESSGVKNTIDVNATGDFTIEVNINGYTKTSFQNCVCRFSDATTFSVYPDGIWVDSPLSGPHTAVSGQWITINDGIEVKFTGTSAVVDDMYNFGARNAGVVSVSTELDSAVLKQGGSTLDSLYASSGSVLTNVPAGALFTDTAYPSDALVTQDVIDVQNLSGTNTGDQDLSGYSTKAESGTSLALKAKFSDLSGDGVISGLTVATSASLSSAVAAGVAYVSGSRIESAGVAKTFTADRHTYTDLDVAGTLVYTEVLTDVAQVDTVSALTVVDSAVYDITIDGTAYTYTSTTPIAQVDDVTVVTAVDANVYAVDVDGTVYSHTAGAASTLVTISNALAALIPNGVADGVSKVTVTSATAGTAQVVTVAGTTTVGTDLTATAVTANTAPDTVAEVLTGIDTAITSTQVTTVKSATDITITANVAGTAIVSSKTTTNYTLATTTANVVEGAVPAITSPNQRLAKVTTDAATVAAVVDLRSVITLDLDLKADKLTTYTKTEVDSSLILKANQTTTYTKVETDNAITAGNGISPIAAAIVFG